MAPPRFNSWGRQAGSQPATVKGQGSHMRASSARGGPGGRKNAASTGVRPSTPHRARVVVSLDLPPRRAGGASHRTEARASYGSGLLSQIASRLILPPCFASLALVSRHGRNGSHVAPTFSQTMICPWRERDHRARAA